MALAASLVLLGGLATMALAMGKGPEVPRMTKEELLPMLGQSDVIILDVRIGDEWKKSPWKIKGAVRENPEKGGSTRHREVPQRQDPCPLLNLTQRGDQCLDGTAAYIHGLHESSRTQRGLRRMVQSPTSGRTKISTSKKDMGGFALLLGLVIPGPNRFLFGIKLDAVIG
jgi:hypothetical protein